MEGMINVMLTFLDEDGNEWFAAAIMGPLNRPRHCPPNT